MENARLINRPEATSEGHAFGSPSHDFLLHQICSLSHRMRSIAYRTVLNEFGLDLRDWLVLSALAELDSASQRKLASHTSLDKVAVNRAATRLKDRELLRVHPNKRDGRSHLLSLSRAGGEIVDICSTQLQTMEHRILRSLSETQNDELSNILGRLASALEEVELECEAGAFKLSELTSMHNQ